MGKDSKDAGHLASYAGIAPVTRMPGTSIRGESPSRRGNKVLKRDLFLSTFASINACSASRAYYDRKRAASKCNNQAIIALARRRTEVLYPGRSCVVKRNLKVFLSSPIRAALGTELPV